MNISDSTLTTKLLVFLNQSIENLKIDFPLMYKNKQSTIAFLGTSQTFLNGFYLNPFLVR